MLRATGFVFLLGWLTVACGTSVFSLEVGDCFDDPDSFAEEIGSVETVDCAQAHDNEIYATLTYAAGAQYPGDLEMFEYAADVCLAPFESFVGIDYRSSSLDYSYLTPTQGSWDDGDREIICFLYDLSLAKLTGSMRGSGV